VAGLLAVEGLVSLIADDVNLDVLEATVGLGELECVAVVSVHVPIRQRGATVAEEVHHFVDGLLVAGQEVPEGGRILGVRLGIALLRVYEGGKLDPVSDEKD